jgi:hypothetical protein
MVRVLYLIIQMQAELADVEKVLVFNG